MPIPVFTKTTLFLFVCLLLTGYFVYTASSGTVRQRQQNEDHRDAVAEIEDLRSRRDHLLGVYDYVVTDAYVEQAARRELGYIREGEIAFVVLSPPPDSDQQLSGEWWERLFPR